MAKINILDKDVYNKISAGEVVEKPASVVKELVENSIDAKANNITIEIIDGGITQIKVSDNGCGIDKDDYDKVFLAHATSKVKTIDDLSSIGTLGFRGEALSSIAAVSKVTLSSKTDADMGYQMKVIDGVLGDLTPIGATQGTYMIIEDLFYNIPARKKFLRKPKLEENDITNYIARLILANPYISFKYIADHKLVYQSYGTGLYDAIYAIYGKSIVDNIFEFKFKNGDYSFSGYLGKPTFSKPNRTYQTLIINGRYVINQTISTAIFKAYENFIMKGTFPFFVINLNLPLDKIDVNVHPNKLDIKFEDSNHIFGMVYSGISDILYNIDNTKTISFEEEKNENSVDTNKLKDYSQIGSQFSINNTSNDNKDNDDEIKEVSLTDTIEYEINKDIKEVDDLKEQITNLSTENKEKIIPFLTSNTFEFKVKSPEIEPTKEDNYVKPVVIEDNFIDDNQNNFKVIGTLFNTYILVEKDNKLLCIDQHAGHERLLYDKFSNEMKNKQVAIQPLLMPYILETNYVEKTHINNNLEILLELGFDIEEFGDSSFKVSTVPLLFDNLNINQFFDTILADLDSKLQFSKNDTIKEYLAKSACRAAVKANDKLSENEINILLSNLNKEGQILLCPHGRPIIIEISQKEIEKWFKRIV